MVLARSRRYQLMAETARAKDVEALVRQHDAQILLLDLVLRDGPGLDLAAHLKETLPSLRILIVTGDASPLIVKDALRIGVDGFVLKEGKGEELLKAMDTVVSGQRYVGPH